MNLKETKKVIRGLANGQVLSMYNDAMYRMTQRQMQGLDCEAEHEACMFLLSILQERGL